ncbi:hypothetical protein Hamer_G007253 [Homarus americanus]|uniref:Uncharacterized protein n=1 Tax=Homarus americanus TaxID=6706 RepID=A0A8J5JVV4_HOMAM|nr:hypothetical protein Hamer_G007253 [Homarus americanus]
MHAITSTRDKL